jgi:hypothetical protein
VSTKSPDPCACVRTNQKTAASYCAELLAPKLNMGLLLFILFINDLPKFMRDKSTPILFADNTRIFVSHSNLSDFKNDIKIIFTNLTLSLLMSYIYGPLCKARNFNVVYIWT